MEVAPKVSRAQSHIPILDQLRGLAALAVCFFHFTNGNRSYLPDGDTLKQIGSFGWLGVESFFVISGFVIPYSLYLRDYKIHDIGGFTARRLKRLEPPYIACIALVIGLHYLSASSAGFKGQVLDLSWQRLAAHIGYLNAILDYGWLNPVFWTLAIEFQYYFFIALAYPLLTHGRLSVRLASVLAVALTCLIGGANKALLPHWLPLFALGMAAFQYHCHKIPGAIFGLLCSMIVVIAWLFVGPLEALVGAATALIIVLAKNRSISNWLSPLSWYGIISYSLYLVHVPVGGRVINLCSRVSGWPSRYAGIVVAFAVSTVAALAFWWLVERPSQHWAKGKSGSRGAERELTKSKIGPATSEG